MGVLLTRDDILNADDIKFEEVSVPEWGGTVRVKAMNAMQRDNFELQHMKGKLKNYRALVASRCICDADNNAIFDEAEVARLAQKSASALNRVFNVAIRLSGVTEEDVEELEKT